MKWFKYFPVYNIRNKIDLKQNYAIACAYTWE